jgi:hypothetical protein
MVINAVFELLTDDWDRTDSREVSNYPQLIDVGEIREDSRVQKARARWNIITCQLAHNSSSVLVRRVLITEFEFARCLYFVGCVVFVNESDAEFDTVLTEDIGEA